MRIVTYIDRADKVLIPHQYIRHTDAENYSKDPSADEKYKIHIGRHIKILNTAKCNTANVGEDIVCYYKGGG